MAIDFSSKPYYDDFSEKKGFYKILFKPGVSVQARELNQLQQILQNQISKLGDHVFKNGSMVIPGQIRLNDTAKYVILDNVDNDPQLAEKLKGKTIKQQIESGDLIANIVETEELIDNKILAIIAYKNSAIKTINGKKENISEFLLEPVEIEEDPSINVSIAISGPSNEPYKGKAITLLVEPGVFYIDGYFVYCERQSKIVAWNYDEEMLTVKVGLKVEKSIVTSFDDESLLDNALGYPNENAPGADRFFIGLKLEVVDFDDESDFIELLRYEKGQLKTIKKYSDYNVLEDTLARRTYDESGDYVVEGLDIKVLEHLRDEQTPEGFRPKEKGGDPNLLAVEVSKGKAYIKGYEVEIPGNIFLEVEKARTPDTIRSENDVLQINDYGEFIYLSAGNYFIDLSRHPIIWLTNGHESNSKIIGYCIPKHIESFRLSDQIIFKLFGSFFLTETLITSWHELGGWKLDDIRNGPVLQRIHIEKLEGNGFTPSSTDLPSHQGFSPYAWDSTNKILYVKKSFSVRQFDINTAVVQGSTSGYVSKIEQKISFPKEGGDLIKFSIENIKTTKDKNGNIELQAIMPFNILISTDQNGHGEFLYNGDGIFVGSPTAANTEIDLAYFDNIVEITDNGKKLVINNSSYPNSSFSVCAYLQKNLTVKQKSLVEGFTTISTPSSRLTALKHKDIFRLKHVYISADLNTPASETDRDYVKYFELVNNDTLDFYQTPFLKPKEGFGIPSGQMKVVYDYFIHSSGDVFTVDSYSVLKDNPNDEDDVTHISRIPVFEYRKEKYYLSDYLDFRQKTRDGFFIIRGTIYPNTSDPNDITNRTILVSENYKNVIETGSKVYANGFTSGTATVESVEEDKIIINENVSGLTGPSVLTVIINHPQAANVTEPFYPQEQHLWAPASNHGIVYDVSYFLSRLDRIVCSKNGIQYLYGTPGVNEYPQIPENSISLATLVIPPYTFSASSVKYKKDDNRRYTMRDIGKLEKRIENLEYYTTLTLKELETKDLKILDTEGNDRFKCGFFVSDFSDFGVFDPFGKDFRATLVSEENKIVPREYSYSINLKLNESLSSNYVIRNKKLMMPYTHVVEVEQPYATTTESINPYLIIGWNASMTLEPNKDNWIETNWAPAITNVHNISRTITNVRNIISNNVNIVSTIHTSRYSWWANSNYNVTTTSYINAGRRLRSVNTSTSTSTQTTTLTRTRLLGESIIPFIRSRIVRFRAKNLKPETRYWASFESKDVSQNCRPINPVTHVTGQWGDPLVSDPMGNLEGDFLIPAKTFLTGTRTFTLSDVNLVEYPDAGTECTVSAKYEAFGILRTMQQVITKINITTTRVTITRVFDRNVIRRITTIHYRVGDPLAQSFFTEDLETSGLFITKIDVYFRKKDYKEPVFLELREMKNGYPVEERIPGAIVGLPPEEVNVSEDSTVPTTFEFDEPVWISANKDYAFVLFSNSSRYHVWVSRMGEKVVNEEKIIGKQPSLGSLFKSQNAKTWTPFQLEDIKFKVYRAKFDPNNITKLTFEGDGNVSTRKSFLSEMKTEENSKLVTIKHENHGMNVNEIVRIKLDNENSENIIDQTESFNGIPITEILGNKIVKEVVDIDHFKIEVTTSANKTGYFEDVGRYILIDCNVNYAKYKIQMDEFSPSGTTIDYKSSLITGKDFDGNQTIRISLPEKQIGNDNLIELENVALAQISENEVEKSIKVKANLRTTSDYVSPVLSLENNSFVIASYAINKPDNDNESDPKIENGKVSSKLITQVIRLKTKADSLRIFTSENKSVKDDIEIYYRTSVNRDIEEKNWIKIEPLNVAISYDRETFIEHERRVENIPEFDEFQIKILLKGRDSTKIPMLKELRAIAVAG